MTLKKYLVLLLLLVAVQFNCNECEPLEGSPAVEITSLPPIGSQNYLQGRVRGVDPEEHKVAVYIYVNGWWNKPYFNSPKTSLDCSSNFSCDITTGGKDESATKLRVYLVSNNYNPPIVSGGKIPSINSLAWIEVER